MAELSKHDNAWNAVFAGLQLLPAIDAHGFVEISANDLKDKGGREPRLMAKMDTRSSRPKIFRDNDLSIFPVNNGKYVIFRDPDSKSYISIYSELENISPELYVPKVPLSEFSTYPAGGPRSESQALDFGLTSSILRTFVNDESLHLTIRGRLHSGSFGFDLDWLNHRVEVDGVQIEVDAGYEGKEGIYLFEAKIGLIDDFHIRQLFYPLMEWRNKSKKSVKPIFFAYTNGKYYLAELRFGEKFGDVQICRKKCFLLDVAAPKIDLRYLIEKATRGIEPDGIPFPQADDVDRIADLVDFALLHPVTSDEIAEHFEFAGRQGAYYGNAAAYLGLVVKEGSRYSVTEPGFQFANANRHERQVQLVEAILSRKVFSEAAKEVILHKDSSQGAIAAILSKSRSDISGSTVGRRAQTVRKWIEWMVRASQLG